MMTSLIGATLLPVAVSLIVYHLDRKTTFGKLSYATKQVIIGTIFGIIASLATEFAIPVEGALINVRSAPPLTAGLLFGGPAGVIAGVIGAVHRWFYVFWGGGEYSRLACTLGTLVAGFTGAACRKFMFDNKKSSWFYGFTIGMTTEVFHMLLVFFTKMDDIHRAFLVVSACALPMILSNAISVMLSMLLVSWQGKSTIMVPREKRQISQSFQSGLLINVVIAFFTTCFFIYALQSQLAASDTREILQLNLDSVEEDLNHSVETTILQSVNEIRTDYSTLLTKNSAAIDKIASEHSVADLYMTDINGNILYSFDGSLIGTNISDHSNFADFMDMPGHYEQKVLSDSLSIPAHDSDAVLYAAANITNGGVVIAGYNNYYLSTAIQNAISSVALGKNIGRTGYIFISDKNGVVVSNGYDDTTTFLFAAGLDLENVEENTVFTSDVYNESSYCMYKNLSTIAGDYVITAIYPEIEADFAKDISVHISIFVEILVFAAVFAHIYILIKKLIVDNIHKINASLAQITSGNLDVVVDVHSNEEFASLSNDINTTVTTLKKYIDEAAARIDKELEFAKTIQHSTLPNVFPPYPNRKDFDIYAHMRTAKEVGGDFYDFYLLDEDRLAILVADVSGKGIPAAMFMMTAKTLIKGLAETGIPVNEIFEQANEKLCEGNEAGMFVTAWMGIVNLRTGVISYSNAGHNPPLIRRQNGRFEYLRNKPNFILAGMEGIPYRYNEAQIFPGDEIFLYTDGVTEATNSSMELYGEERLLEAINMNPDEDVKLRCERILQSIDSFAGKAEQFDDITMLTVRLNHLVTYDKILVSPDTLSMQTVWEFIDGKMQDAGVSQRIANKVQIAVDEIYSNIIHYSKATLTQIFCHVDNDLITLVFRDNGTPYDPTANADPDTTLSADERQIGGLGIFMVKKMSESMEYTFENGQNSLKITFKSK